MYSPSPPSSESHLCHAPCTAEYLLKFLSSRIVTKLTFDPKSLQEEVEQLRKTLLTAMEQLDASTVPGFITTYGFLCDFFGVPFSEEVSWVGPFC